MTHILHRKHERTPDDSRARAYAKIEREQAEPVTDPRVMAMHRKKDGAESGEKLARYTGIERRSDDD